jgi:general secretion pathway protein G
MEKGFTLLEVIVVLAIISIFAGIVGTVIGTSVLSTEIEASEDRMDLLRDALLAYYADTDEFPAATGNTENDLADLVTDPGTTGWNGPYISSGFENGDFLKDAWKRSLTYTYSSGTASCVIAGNGPDGINGNSDDITMTVDATSVYRRKTERVRQELEIIKVAAQVYATNNGFYPSAIGDLFTGGYLSDESYRRDEWLSSYQVESNQFISYGPDMALGGGDDIYPY